MENYTLGNMLELLEISILSGFLISCIPFIVGVGVHCILKIFKKVI